MRAMLWGSCLGIAGAILFGQKAFIVFAMIGYAISFWTESATPRKKTIRQIDESSLPPKTALIESQRWLRPRPIVVIAIVVLALLGLWLFIKFNNPEARSDSAQIRPQVEVGYVWSREDCMTSKFPYADPKQAKSLEVNLACAYPWDPAKFQSLLTLLKSYEVTMDAYATSFRNPTKESEDKEAIQILRELQPDDSVLLQLRYLLPLVLAATGDSKSEKATLENAWNPDFVEHLKEAARHVNWSESLTRQTVVRRILDTAGGPVVLVTDHLNTVTALEFASIILMMQADPVNLEHLSAKLADLPPVAAGFFISGKYVRSGFTPQNAVALAFLEFYIGRLQAKAQQLRIQPKIADWAPANTPDRNPMEPLEIYWLSSPPKNWCNGALPRLHGSYCKGEDRIFAMSLANSNTSEPGKTGDASVGIGPELLHEIAHVYLNSKIAEDSPFVTEGIVTAIGEDQARAAYSAASLRLNYEQVLQLTHDFSNKDTPVPTASGTTISSSKAPNSASNLSRYVDDKINQFPPTLYMKRALCVIHKSPITPDVVENFVTYSIDVFQGQDPSIVEYEYAYAWAIFHYGLDVEALSENSSSGATDAGVVQEISLASIRNSKITPDQHRRLLSLVNEVNRKVEIDFNKWSKNQCKIH